MTTTCVESGLLLTLKFSPPFEITPTQNGFTDPKDAAGGWDFLQALTTAAAKNSGDQPEAPVYVHPLVKRSESMLSEKSLEMCTESLFSETGSDDTTVELPSLPETYPAREISRRRRAGRSSGELPPPLPSISGAGGVQVEAMREGGRLVMKAVKVSPVHACFKAERGDGRLRLSFSDECGRRCCNDMGDEEEESEDNGCGCDEDRGEEEGESGKIENYGGRPQGSMSRCNEEENMKKREMNNISQGAYWVATS